MAQKDSLDSPMPNAGNQSSCTAKINIATFHLGRTKVGGDAIALIEIDEAVSTELIETLNNIPQVKSVKPLNFAKNII